ncbi:sensor histidine kinase [Pseudomonadota bacterium]
MKLKNSLRFRLVISFAAFAAVLAIMYGFSVWIAVVWSEDNSLEQRLKTELQYYLEVVGPNTPSYERLDRYISSYIGHSTLPKSYQRLISHEDGIVELRDPFNVYILAKRLDTGDILYLVYDVTKLETLQDLEPIVFAAIAISGVLVILIGIWIGKILANRVIAPVTQLASIFHMADTTALPNNFAKDYYGDEVGFLALTLENQVQQINEFVERETRFSRDASHELRTPVTSIKLALGLLLRMPEANASHVRKPLQRIQRATSDMQHLLETLLWLSRESQNKHIRLDGSAEDLVEKNIENHRYLISDKSVDIEFESQVNEMVMVPEQLFSIAIGNIIRNAFQFTERGFVKVLLTEQMVRVCDSGIGIASDTQASVVSQDSEMSDLKGYGFGLEIVNRICDLCGWRVEIESGQIQGTHVTIYFDIDEIHEPVVEPITSSEVLSTGAVG